MQFYFYATSIMRWIFASRIGLAIDVYRRFLLFVTSIIRVMVEAGRIWPHS